MNRPGGTLAGPGRLPGGGGDAGQCSHRRWRWCLRNAAHEQGERRPAACQRAGAHATAAPKLQRRRGTPGAPMPGAPAAGGGAGAPGCSRVRQGSPRARLVAQLVGGPLVCGQLQRARACRQPGQEAPPHDGRRRGGRRWRAHAAHEAPRQHLRRQPRRRGGGRRQRGAQLRRAALLPGPAAGAVRPPRLSQTARHARRTALFTTDAQLGRHAAARAGQQARPQVALQAGSEGAPGPSGPRAASHRARGARAPRAACPPASRSASYEPPPYYCCLPLVKLVARRNSNASQRVSSHACRDRHARTGRQAQGGVGG